MIFLNQATGSRNLNRRVNLNFLEDKSLGLAAEEESNDIAALLLAVDVESVGLVLDRQRFDVHFQA